MVTPSISRHIVRRKTCAELAIVAGRDDQALTLFDRHSVQTIPECCSSVALVEPLGRNPYLARTLE
jgi:hypothetical protein